ncbi:hypothetical protein Calag_1541 [Caldisphaera lagunensis DSM 15908]|uniref:Uncharacterized protein n=1 Tax=Caldisphaera lagunensis (strain DSM 15908 / JCM 11604 / ANMR 0165 / IC-154) TaxID=1056495 RepID=L0ACT5_CALLD|nr:hypothetical protein [Caldisphaera lagunensis]AFZ71239.1 hypothetical protein Calag_1541 [Caldisphaera lagunensis DSM 15908]
MSDQTTEKAISKEELIEWLRKRIDELKDEMKMLETLLSYIEDSSRQNLNEKGEEVKLGRRRLGKIYRGESYVRLVPDIPIPLPQELKEYLETVEGELRTTQIKNGLQEQEQAKLVIKERPDASIAEIRFENLTTTIEILKAKAALKYTAEVAYQIYKAQNKNEGEEENKED